LSYNTHTKTIRKITITLRKHDKIKQHNNIPPKCIGAYLLLACQCCTKAYIKGKGTFWVRYQENIQKIRYSNYVYREHILEMDNFYDLREYWNEILVKLFEYTKKSTFTDPAFQLNEIYAGKESPNFKVIRYISTQNEQHHLIQTQSTIDQRWSRCWGRMRPSPIIYIIQTLAKHYPFTVTHPTEATVASNLSQFMSNWMHFK
jgi:hypothetical protein